MSSQLRTCLRTIKIDSIITPTTIINGKILYDISPVYWKTFWTICNWDTIIKMFPHTEEGKIQCEKEMWEIYHYNKKENQ
jgi:hypothetical protein